MRSRLPTQWITALLMEVNPVKYSLYAHHSLIADVRETIRTMRQTDFFGLRDECFLFIYSNIGIYITDTYCHIRLISIDPHGFITHVGDVYKTDNHDIFPEVLTHYIQEWHKLTSLGSKNAIPRSTKQFE